MDRLLEPYLSQVKSSVSEMAGLVEESLVLSTKSLAKREAKALDRVFELEEKINEFHRKIHRDCFKILARQSPVASDLRLLIASLKLSVNLERMGGLACSMSHSISNYLNGQVPLPTANEIPKMADVVRFMLRKGLNAFLQNDESQALEVLSTDEVVDDYRDRLSQEIRQSLQRSNHNSEMQLELFTIIHNMERIGDHASNIAEEAIFLSSGEDVRHQNLGRS